MTATETEIRAAALLRSEYAIPDYLRHGSNVRKAEGVLARAWLRESEREKPEDQHTTLDDFTLNDFSPWLYDVRANSYYHVELERALLDSWGKEPLAIFGPISTTLRGLDYNG